MNMFAAGVFDASSQNNLQGGKFVVIKKSRTDARSYPKLCSKYGLETAAITDANKDDAARAIRQSGHKTAWVESFNTVHGGRCGMAMRLGTRRNQDLIKNAKVSYVRRKSAKFVALCYLSKAAALARNLLRSSSSSGSSSSSSGSDSSSDSDYSVTPRSSSSSASSSSSSDSDSSSSSSSDSDSSSSNRKNKNRNNHKHELSKDQQKLALGLTKKPVVLAQQEEQKSRPRVE